MDKLDLVNSIFNSSKQIPFDDSSKFILMSDCHRGNGSWSDNFLKNRNIFIGALTHYYNNNYTYIELGDGDELWENTHLSDIMSVHKDTFKLLSKFHNEGRLYMLYGNHDLEKKDFNFIKRNLKRFFNQREEEFSSIFESLEIHEGLVLRYEATGDKILLIHGHQVNTLNYDLWWLGKLLVKHLWKPLESIGINDPTSAAKNYEVKISIAKQLTEWVIQENHILIAGHNHKPSFPEVGQPPYFNDGSCIHPRCITGIEIAQGYICLVKWSVKTREDGTLYIDRDILAGPRKLRDYFLSLKTINP